MKLPQTASGETPDPRRRVLVAVTAVIVVAILYAWLVHSASRARDRLGTSVAALREQAMLLERHAAEYERLRAQPARAAARGDLADLVRSQAARAGLDAALVRTDVPEPGRVHAVFGAVPFAEWLLLVRTLQSMHVRLEASRIEAMAAPGMVNVTATFTRTAPR